ncbi:SMP-30/gluconolactonase/LRE family protein [Planomonospora sp. ID67723]|uniref:SMP-30/gluconolactonase/LRE family protein n=1 Tax=Planomonospora sp. ID67723 TaxID=2738134 RepID=UPI0018C365BA|nr:SMP-30/gluconolactonase/LRE family protein [Planomonospora sp. ID67723]MBG0831837.1 SMP-30/gluconolactonase/LRE family protein [Planomonospora sp. ID67723]
MRIHRLLSLAVAAVVLASSAGTASATATEAAGVAAQADRPGVYVLAGDDAYPEGIARDPRTPYFYVGSVTDGRIYRGDVRSPQTSVWLPGNAADGRTTAGGMKVDAAGRLIVAGGATGFVWVYDTRTGALLHRFATATPNSMLNDVAVAGNGDVYVTDSFQPTIYRIGAAELRGGSGATAPLRPFLDLRGTDIVYTEGFNLNGITVTPDQRYLVVADYNDGVLHRVDLRRRTVRPIDLGGALVRGDGLLLRGHTLYAVSNADGDGNTVNVIRLDVRSGRGRLLARVTDPRLHGPSTAAFDGRDLLVVNFQYGATSPVLPYTVVRLTPDRGRLG